MKTKFTKVAVEERLPENDGNYFVWVDNPNSRSKDKSEDYNMDKKQFDISDNEFKSFYEVTHWLEESPDREDEMIEMLEELVELKRIKDLDGKTPDYLQRQPKAWDKAKSLLQSLKQPSFSNEAKSN